MTQVFWQIGDDDFSEDNISASQALTKPSPFTNSIYIGYAIDNLFAPPDVVKFFYADLRGTSKDRAKLITTHDISGPMAKRPTANQILHDYGLLRPDILVSHADHPSDGDGALYNVSGADGSTPPNSEMQAGAFP
ncbi:ribonuclease HI [Apiospora arundinis]